MVRVTLHELHSARLKKKLLCNPFLSDGFSIPACILAAIAEHVPSLKPSFWNRRDRTIHNLSNEVLHDFLYHIKASLLLVKYFTFHLSFITVAAHSHLTIKQ